jgi:hypothetical protein
LDPPPDDPGPLGAALEVLAPEFDCALAQAPINTATTTAPPAMEPASFRESIGELLVALIEPRLCFVESVANQAPTTDAGRASPLAAVPHRC